jgi:methylated-DNA-[protein]-cysteine S-methyltransferase
MMATVCDRTEDEILAYVSGELREDEELRIAIHLGECEECCVQAAEFRALDMELPECCGREAIRWHSFETPFGRMYAAASDEGLVRLSWQQPDEDGFLEELRQRFPDRPSIRDAEALAEVEREMREYFGGMRDSFEIPVDLSFLTEFQQRVLVEARAIRFGQVVPYSELARRIGKPKAARAVGNALGSNPVAIVVPCHRVVRNDGGLGGYGGGVHYKERLLEIEGRADLLDVAS